MRKYLKYILMGILAVTLSSIFFKKKTEAETSLPRDYAEIAASGILRAVTEYNSISFYADGDTVSGFHYLSSVCYGWKFMPYDPNVPDLIFAPVGSFLLTGVFPFW